mmetsp:Transcript_13212/g.41446  ORF Transcript_13212/g.41446 Transcript_13212/m.41446 type:complete len:223 (-) Transcript_13212:11-679(-)
MSRIRASAEAGGRKRTACEAVRIGHQTAPNPWYGAKGCVAAGHPHALMSTASPSLGSVAAHSSTRDTLRPPCPSGSVSPTKRFFAAELTVAQHRLRAAVRESVVHVGPNDRKGAVQVLEALAHGLCTNQRLTPGLVSPERRVREQRTLGRAESRDVGAQVDPPVVVSEALGPLLHEADKLVAVRHGGELRGQGHPERGLGARRVEARQRGGHRRAARHPPQK